MRVLGPNWEGPYRVRTTLRLGTYELETLRGTHRFPPLERKAPTSLLSVVNYCFTVYFLSVAFPFQVSDVIIATLCNRYNSE